VQVNLDDDPEIAEADQLPPPLQPQVVSTSGSGGMCRSLSEFLSNITETTCTNAAAEATTSEFPVESGLLAVPDSAEADDAKALGVVSEAPAVSVTAEDADRAVDNDGASSPLLDSTAASTVDMSLLDDPFIAIGAGCEKDSLLEEPIGDDPDRTNSDDALPATSSPEPSSREKVGTVSELASADVSEVLEASTVPEETHCGPVSADIVDDTTV